jgi:hypothetical protein
MTTVGRPAITIHAFASAKGGVGKSSLAVAAASLLERLKGRHAVVIDCDLTGSSLADGLRLLAPNLVADEAGRLDLLTRQPPKYQKADQTEKSIELRMGVTAGATPMWVPFLNDALSFVKAESATDCNLAAMLWIDEMSSGVNYLPSSSSKEDIRLALGWLYHVDPIDWCRRFAQLIYILISTVPSLTDIVIDLPPGLFGFSQSVLTLLASLANGEALPPGFPDWKAIDVRLRVNPFLVSSPDRNDLFTAIRAYGLLANRLEGLRLIVNQDNQREKTRRAVKQRFPMFGAEYLLHHLPVGEGLTRLFEDRILNIDTDPFWAQMTEELRLGEGDA